MVIAENPSNPLIDLCQVFTDAWVPTLHALYMITTYFGFAGVHCSTPTECNMLLAILIEVDFLEVDAEKRKVRLNQKYKWKIS
jgi:hypothetical protein